MRGSQGKGWSEGAMGCWMAATRLLLIGTSGADGAMEKVF